MTRFLFAKALLVASLACAACSHTADGSGDSTEGALGADALSKQTNVDRAVMVDENGIRQASNFRATLRRRPTSS